MSNLPQRYDDEIDLTESPHNAVTMATEEDAIAVSSDEEDEDVKPNIKVS